MRVHALLCLLIWSVPVQCQKSETTTTPTTSADQDLSGQLVVGGYDGSNQLSSVEIFPPPSSDTCSIPDLPGPRNGHSLSLLSGGRLVVCGGNSGSTKKNRASLGQEEAPAGPICTTQARKDLAMWLGFQHLFPTPLCCLAALQKSELPRLCQVEEPLNCATLERMPAGFPTKTRL